MLYVRAYDVSTADGRRLRKVLALAERSVSEQKRREDISRVGVAARSEPNWSKGLPSGLLVIASELLARSVLVHELPIVERAAGRARRCRWESGGRTSSSLREKLCEKFTRV